MTYQIAMPPGYREDSKVCGTCKHCVWVPDREDRTSDPTCQRGGHYWELDHSYGICPKWEKK